MIRSSREHILKKREREREWKIEVWSILISKVPWRRKSVKETEEYTEKDKDSQERLVIKAKRQGEFQEGDNIL